MANRRRRGTDPADERRDEELSAEDAAVEEEFADELDELDVDDPDAVDDDVDDEDLDDDDLDDDDDDRAGSNGRRTAVKEKGKRPPTKKSTKTKEAGSRGPIGRLVNFFKEVVAELRKVIWPTRKELLTYTTVVVVFVVVMLSIVGLLDYGFAKAVLWVFGDESADSE